MAIALISFGLACGIGLGEGALRIIGFEFFSVPKVQFGWPAHEELKEMFSLDRELLWTPKDYADKLEVALERHPAIVFRGDSCTQFNTRPELVLKELETDLPELSTGVNLGVAGWSSQQGRWQFERDVVHIRPKVITLYYGWNDHWVALGTPDKDAQPGRVRFWLSEHSRLYQLSSMIGTSVDLRIKERTGSRVELREFRQNLTSIVTSAAGLGITPVLITAASNHIPGAEPKYLAERWLRNLSDLVPLHESYVAGVREVAAETGTHLCDAAQIVEADPQRAEYFMEDGIHYSRAGESRLALLIADCIKAAMKRASSSP